MNNDDEVLGVLGQVFTTLPRGGLRPSVPSAVRDIPGTHWNVVTYEVGVPLPGIDGRSPRTHILMQFADLNSYLAMDRALDISAQLCWMVQAGQLIPVSGGQISVEIITWHPQTGVAFRHVCGPPVIHVPLGIRPYNPKQRQFDSLRPSSSVFTLA